MAEAEDARARLEKKIARSRANRRFSKYNSPPSQSLVAQDGRADMPSRMEQRRRHERVSRPRTRPGRGEDVAISCGSAGEDKRCRSLNAMVRLRPRTALDQFDTGDAGRTPAVGCRCNYGATMTGRVSGLCQRNGATTTISVTSYLGLALMRASTLSMGLSPSVRKSELKSMSECLGNGGVVGNPEKNRIDGALYSPGIPRGRIRACGAPRRTARQFGRPWLE